jgi:pyruvate dehydrogenase (quinone)
LLPSGTDFPYRQVFPEKATIVQIDIRGEQLGRRAKVDQGFVGDTRTTIRALLPHLDEQRDDKHFVAWLEHYRKARMGLDELATAGGATERSHPQYVVRVMNEHIHHGIRVGATRRTDPVPSLSC